jgi:outer membrane murein-binding lipoprotein Lpp
MNVFNRSTSLCAVLVLGLVVLSGCEDQQARTAAGEAAGQVNALKSKIDEALTKNDALQKEVKALREELSSKYEQKLDSVTKELESMQKDFLTKVTASTETAVKQARDNSDRLRADYDSSFAATKTTMAADVQKLREEIKTANDDLKKFMDNQLRELYPYAYQPRRLDPNAAPPAEAK